jgi:hypothetical protein
MEEVHGLMSQDVTNQSGVEFGGMNVFYSRTPWNHIDSSTELIEHLYTPEVEPQEADRQKKLRTGCEKIWAMTRLRHPVGVTHLTFLIKFKA